MPKRHGIYQRIPAGLPKGTRLNRDQVPVFRCGVGQVFESLRADPILPMSVRGSAANLHWHFWTVCQRFVYSLQHLNGLMQRMAANWDSDPLALDSLQIFLEAECQADHVLTYLNTIVDDIAQVIILATGVKHPNNSGSLESMGGLKNPAVVGLPALSPVRTLLVELDNPGTWWELAFKPRKGARQLLIHNRYVVTFHGTQPPGGPMEAKATLISAHVKHDGVDFFSLLREILLSLCDWLDRLEDALVKHLQTLSSTWEPRAKCPSIDLVLGVPLSGAFYHPQYFPFPLCDGADPLPWTIGPPMREGSEPADSESFLSPDPGTRGDDGS
jgi:hypothetical protein